MFSLAARNLFKVCAAWLQIRMLAASANTRHTAAAKPVSHKARWPEAQRLNASQVLDRLTSNRKTHLSLEPSVLYILRQQIATTRNDSLEPQPHQPQTFQAQVFIKHKAFSIPRALRPNRTSPLFALKPESFGLMAPPLPRARRAQQRHCFRPCRRRTHSAP